MAGVVASNVRNSRNKSISLKEYREDEAAIRRLQLRQEQIEANLKWKKKLQSLEGSRGSYVLYIGLGVCSVGLIIFLVGVGDKGFKSIELQLIGPGLIGLGLLLVFLHVLYCTRPGCRHPHPPQSQHNKHDFPDIIKIKSFNEIEKTQKKLDVKVPEKEPETFNKNSEEKLSGTVPLSGSLKNLKSADIILNSSKLILD